jgi:hypothetical protein
MQWWNGQTKASKATFRITRVFDTREHTSSHVCVCACCVFLRIYDDDGDDGDDHHHDCGVSGGGGRMCLYVDTWAAWVPVLPCGAANVHGSRSFVTTIHIDGLAGQHHRLDARLTATVVINYVKEKNKKVELKMTMMNKMI